MKRIAKFHKVSLEQFMEGWKDTFGEQYTEDTMKLLSPFLSHPGFSTGKIPPEIARIRLEWIESKSIF